MPKTPRCLFLIFCSLLTSCGYQWNPEASVGLSIPFMEKDISGECTNALIAQIEKSSFFYYRTDSSYLTLKARIQEKNTEKIGFQNDREDLTGVLQEVLRPVENRDSLVVEAQIVGPTGRIFWGPLYFEAFVDYDYVDENSLEDLSFVDPSGKRRSSLQFSLGALESLFPAQKDASVLLYQNIAQKIVERLSLDYERLQKLQDHAPQILR